GAAQGHVLKDGDVVFDHRRLPDDEAGRMVEEDAFAERHGRVDVRLEYFRRAALQVEGEIDAALLMHPVRQAVRLQGMEPFEVKDGLDVPAAGRIAIVDCGKVDTHAFRDG